LFQAIPAAIGRGGALRRFRFLPVFTVDRRIWRPLQES
jgi:hypothetical protein